MPSIKTSSDSSPGERFDLLTSTDREKSFRHTQRYRTCALEYKGIVLDLGAGYGYGDRIISGWASVRVRAVPSPPAPAAA